MEETKKELTGAHALSSVDAININGPGQSLQKPFDVDEEKSKPLPTAGGLTVDPKVQELLESTKLQPAHLKHVLITGAGFFCDSYDLFVINLVLVLMKDVYGQTSADKSLVASMAIWGAVIGQLTFGFLADVFGRKWMFITTTALMIFGSIGSACTFQNDTFTIYQQMAMWRFFLGVGCGGEYPLAASITSESVSPKLMGPMLASVFSMQGFGQLTGCILVIILLACGVSSDVTWRVALAFGAVPGLIVFAFRRNMHETAHFEDVRRRRPSYWATARIAFKAFWWPFIGTASTWFLMDIFFYGNSLFNGMITQAMGLSSSAYDTALRSLYIALFALPGYLLVIFTINRIGRWNIQVMGFLIVAILYFVLAGAFEPLQTVSSLLIIIYGLSFFFKNFGPNATTYVIPGEYYPTEVKATLHGASAAAGKIGAGIAAETFPHAVDSIGVQNVMFLCASLAVMGLIMTVIFVPRYGVETLRQQQMERMQMFYSECKKNHVNSTTLDSESTEMESRNSPEVQHSV